MNLLETNSTYLFKLDTLDIKAAFLIESIIEPKPPFLHYRIVFLCDLVSLRKIRIKIVLSVKSDTMRADFALKSCYGFVS